MSYYPSPGSSQISSWTPPTEYYDADECPEIKNVGNGWYPRWVMFLNSTMSGHAHYHKRCPVVLNEKHVNNDGSIIVGGGHICGTRAVTNRISPEPICHKHFKMSRSTQAQLRWTI